jgi:hypothetical protein
VVKNVTKLQLITGVVYTKLPPSEVRTYLQGGSKAGTIQGFLDIEGTQPILIATASIEYIFL